jgi:hypothetical protein
MTDDRWRELIAHDDGLALFEAERDVLGELEVWLLATRGSGNVYLPPDYVRIVLDVLHQLGRSRARNLYRLHQTLELELAADEVHALLADGITAPDGDLDASQIEALTDTAGRLADKAKQLAAHDASA